MKSYYIVGIIVIFLVVGFLIWNSQLTKPISNVLQTFPNTKITQTPADLDSLNFSNPKRSAHYESNTPVHGAILAGVPINVVVDFNFDLAMPSEIKVLNSGTDYGVGGTIIDSNKLAMRRNLVLDAPDGLYTVEYKACWPDKSCHEGNFQFVIDRYKAANFDDQTGKKEVTIKLAQIQFKPQNIKISKGTKVTWANDEAAEHYVNTDSHPSHTYYPSQNSKLLKNGEVFSLKFDQPGIYPYHCSFHASSMIGSLLVE